MGCPGDDERSVTLSGDSTTHNITGLEEDSSYIITLRASNAAGSVDVNVAVMTLEAGITVVVFYVNGFKKHMLCVCSSIWFSWACECIWSHIFVRHCSVGGGGLYPKQRKRNRLLSEN